MAHPQQYLFHPYETYGEELMRKSVRIPCPSYQGSTFPRWGKPSDGSAGVAADFINGDVKIFASVNDTNGTIQADGITLTTYIFDEDGTAATSPAASISGRYPIVNNGRIITHTEYSSFPTKQRAHVYDYSLNSIGTIDFPYVYYRIAQSTDGYLLMAGPGRGYYMPDVAGVIRLYDDTTLNLDLTITSPNGNVNDGFPGNPFLIDGYIWASASYSGYEKVYIYNTSGTLLTTITGSNGFGAGMSYDPVNNLVAISEYGYNTGSSAPKIYQPDGTFVRSISLPSQDTLWSTNISYLQIGMGKLVYSGGGYSYGITGNQINKDTFILDNTGDYITDVYPKYALGASPAYPTTDNHLYADTYGSAVMLHNVNKMSVAASQEDFNGNTTLGAIYIYDI